MHEPAPGAPTARPLVGLGDVAILVALVGTAVALRLAWFSGLGLGDDLLLRYDIQAIVRTGHPNVSPNVYRFAWWIPSVITARWFGLGEAGLITPIVVFDAVGLVLVYLLGNALHGRTVATIATALAAATPLDFAWATMLTTDVTLSVFAAATMLFVVRALQHDDPLRKRRAWMLAAIALWLAYHSKLSAIFLVPAIVLYCAGERDRLDETASTFVVTAAVLFAGTFVITWVFSGDALAPYHIELRAQGLTGVDAKAHPATLEHVLLFVRWLFLPIWTDSMIFSVYGWALVVLGTLGLALGVRPSALPGWWFLFLLLGMTFNVQRVDGMWVSGFRNVRHAHPLILPLALLVAAYLGAWAARWPRSALVAVVALVGVGLWQSVATARITHVAFADCRNACDFLATRPPKPVYSDFQLGNWLGFAGLDQKGFTLTAVPMLEPAKLEELLASPKPAYLVTGGGREPYYGCIHCIPRAANVPPGHWRLLREFPDPIPPNTWRPETLRIWESMPAR